MSPCRSLQQYFCMEICKIRSLVSFAVILERFGLLAATGSHSFAYSQRQDTERPVMTSKQARCGKKHILDMHGQSWAIHGSCLFLPAPELNGRPMMTFDDLEFEQVSCIWGSLASFILNREFEEVPCRRLALQSVVVLQMLQLAPTLAQ